MEADGALVHATQMMADQLTRRHHPMSLQDFGMTKSPSVVAIGRGGDVVADARQFWPLFTLIAQHGTYASLASLGSYEANVYGNKVITLYQVVSLANARVLLWETRNPTLLIHAISNMRDRDRRIMIQRRRNSDALAAALEQKTTHPDGISDQQLDKAVADARRAIDEFDTSFDVTEHQRQVKNVKSVKHHLVFSVGAPKGSVIEPGMNVTMNQRLVMLYEWADLCSWLDQAPTSNYITLKISPISVYSVIAKASAGLLTELASTPGMQLLERDRAPGRLFVSHAESNLMHMEPLFATAAKLGIEAIQLTRLSGYTTTGNFDPKTTRVILHDVTDATIAALISKYALTWAREYNVKLSLCDFANAQAIVALDPRFITDTAHFCFSKMRYLTITGKDDIEDIHVDPKRAKRRNCKCVNDVDVSNDTKCIVGCRFCYLQPLEFPYPEFTLVPKVVVGDSSCKIGCTSTCICNTLTRAFGRVAQDLYVVSMSRQLGWVPDIGRCFANTDSIASFCKDAINPKMQQAVVVNAASEAIVEKMKYANDKSAEIRVFDVEYLMKVDDDENDEIDDTSEQIPARLVSAAYSVECFKANRLFHAVAAAKIKRVAHWLAAGASLKDPDTGMPLMFRLIRSRERGMDTDTESVDVASRNAHRYKTNDPQIMEMILESPMYNEDDLFRTDTEPSSLEDVAGILTQGMPVVRAPPTIPLTAYESGFGFIKYHYENSDRLVFDRVGYLLAKFVEKCAHSDQRTAIMSLLSQWMQ